MKKRKELTLSLSCFLLAFLCSMIWLRQREENLAEQISPKILRFHVNSKEDFVNYIQEQKEDLASSAESYMRSLGYPYKAQIEVNPCYFPTKSYGDLVLPCGTYDAVEIQIGEGRGRNWWCVLYPRLCFVDVSHAVVPDSSRAVLQDLLTPEQYEALWDRKEVTFRPRFLLPELATGLIAPQTEY